jgi:hypothetical protein
MKFKESRPFATSEAIAHGWITMHPSGALPVAHASRGGSVCVIARLTGAHEMARYPGDLSGWMYPARSQALGAIRGLTFWQGPFPRFVPKIRRPDSHLPICSVVYL